VAAHYQAVNTYYFTEVKSDRRSWK